MSEFLKNKFNLTEEQLKEFNTNIRLTENEIYEIFQKYTNLSYQDLLDYLEMEEIIKQRASDLDLTNSWHISSDMTEDQQIEQFMKLFNGRMTREEIEDIIKNPQ